MSLIAKTFISVFCVLWLSFSIFLEGHLYENGRYPAFCQLAANHDEFFDNFKNNPAYREILEGLSYEEGQQYLTVIQEKYPQLLDRIEEFRANDAIGHPITYAYGQFGRISPTTLRYLKIAGELQEKFGDLSQFHIVEIGGGYGGQCKTLATLCGFKSYTIIDIAECCALTQKYLTLQKVNGVEVIDFNHLPQNLPHCDLVISNYAFSELDRPLQNLLLDEVIKPASRGYMTMNFLINKWSPETLSMEHLVSQLYDCGRKGKVERECPLTAFDNLLISWKTESFNHTNEQPPVQAPHLLPGCQSGNAVSYSLSGGRLGDNLLAYIHAKWIAYKYNLPLLYQPFPYSDQFSFHYLEQIMDNSFIFTHRSERTSEQMITCEPISALFIIPYFPEFKLEHERLCPHLPFFKVDWENAGFKEEIARCLAPINSTLTLELPKDGINLGVHVRRPVGIDNYALVFDHFPLKFPPDSYYIQQIAKIAEIFSHKKIYVHVISDDLAPRSIVETFNAALDYPNLEFRTPAEGTSSDNILSDFFLISKFDCLIIPQSNFSITASKLREQAIIIHPLNYRFINGQLAVDEVELSFNGTGVTRPSRSGLLPGRNGLATSIITFHN